MWFKGKMCPWKWTIVGQKVGPILKMGVRRRQFLKEEMGLVRRCGLGKICYLGKKCVFLDGLGLDKR
jgi:hypothetical protein